MAAIFLSVISCKNKNKDEAKIAEVPLKNLVIERFDKIFYESSGQDLPKIKQQFPYFFPVDTEDAEWIAKMKDPLLQELHDEVEKKFPDDKMIKKDLQTLFQHIEYYFPGIVTPPKVVTLISEMDYENKTIYTDSLALISLDLYLGKDHRFYEFPNYLKQTFEPSQMMPDMVSSFSQGKIAPPKDRTLLAQMVYYGKELYLKDLLVPSYSDANKIGYTEEQIKWCEENEAEMWRYFIDDKLLFDTNPKLNMRFIQPAPFSKFYLEIDNESPGRVGTWLGWQIVRSYAERNKDVTLQELLALDAKTLFDNSKYKPKK